MSLGQLQNEGDLKRWLENEADILFGQLPFVKSLQDSSGARKRGEEALVISEGVVTSEVMEVAHGLQLPSDQIPRVFLQVEVESSSIAFTPHVIERTSTHFKFRVNADSALLEDTAVVVMWEAAL